MHNLVKDALKEKAPALHKSLSDSGKLNQYVADLAQQMQSEINSLTDLDSQRNGWSKLDPMERVGKLNQAKALNREKVLAEMLEFPQDGTLPPNQD